MCLDVCECVCDSGKLKQCHVVTLPAGCVLVASYCSLPIKAVLCSAADCLNTTNVFISVSNCFVQRCVTADTKSSLMR